MHYETVIGLEVHAQLMTNSKMFCGCDSNYQDGTPNSVVCAVCMGMPGTLPVINKKAVEHTIRTGLALGCTIAESTKFDRKNYPYPDLMKGYQISQFDMPIASNGFLQIETSGITRTIGVTRVHLEEDAAKLLHRTEISGENYTLLDINRSGTPLMEIVGDPDLRTPEEAREYLVQLQLILQYLGSSIANMEEGNFRCDANVSVRRKGYTELGTKVEVKNMNSFRSVQRAIQFESERQVALLERGDRIVQETRGWVDDQEITVSQRTKEYASDYRYFPDPDLPPITLHREWVEKIKNSQPELPMVRRARFIEDFGLSSNEAELLTTSSATADYFEMALKTQPTPSKHLAKSVSNWILGELGRLRNQTKKPLEEVRINPNQLVELQQMLDLGELSSTLAKEVFGKMYSTGDSPRMIAESEGLLQISDTKFVGDAIEEAISGNSKPTQDYLEGKQAAFQFLVGQVMRITKGKANPQIATKMLREKLEDMR